MDGDPAEPSGLSGCGLFPRDGVFPGRALFLGGVGVCVPSRAALGSRSRAPSLPLIRSVWKPPGELGPLREVGGDSRGGCEGPHDSQGRGTGALASMVHSHVLPLGGGAGRCRCYLAVAVLLGGQESPEGPGS